MEMKELIRRKRARIEKLRRELASVKDDGSFITKMRILQLSEDINRLNRCVARLEDVYGDR